MANLRPEEQARVTIDRMLTDSGWAVQDHRDMNISAAFGVAVREFPLKTGFADYMLYADARAIGVVEAKPLGHTLTGVEPQSDKYTLGLPDGLPHYKIPLPFTYESTGDVTQFTNHLEPDARSREVFTFHRPQELIRLVKLDAQVRAQLRQMPPLERGKLWQVQEEAVRNLEQSLAMNRPRALIQMATGSGKTFTACNFCYRLIKYANARRILFLVDRNNLGRQTLNEFQQFDSPGTQYSFTEEYNVQHLRKNTIEPASKIVITTIQRLFSMLKGEEALEDDLEETSLFESATALQRDPASVAYNPGIPIETFDFIVVDECHRSIYNIWRQVLEYFDAFIIGLTATPTAQTIGFFNGNLVQDYSHERAVADKVNVGYEVYRIETQITSQGATLKKEPGIQVPHRDRRTRHKRYEELDDDLTYTANQLDRDVVNPNQIRLVIRTFRDRLFTEIFPGRTEVPKTLIFAKTDLHADDIVKIVREEFSQGNDFCVKITSKTTGHKPEDLLKQFRNSYNPRIAVTVDMIATGTDVKPLECLIFMRNISSAGYFEQMKGRGVRVVNPDDLQSVSPDVRQKTHFVIVDAVGVCETDKSPSKPLDRQPSVSFEKLMNSVAAGMVSVDVVSTLGSRLARLEQKINDTQADEIEQVADTPGGLPTLTGQLLHSIDPDANTQRAVQKFNLPDDAEPTEAQLTEVEHEAMTEALKPFHNPKLRETIQRVKTSTEQIIDETTPDELIRAGFDEAAREKARTIISDLRQFIEDNRDEIEALQVLYSRPHRAGLRYRHVKELAGKLDRPPFYVSPKQPDSVGRLWNAFEATEPGKVRGKARHLVDLIAMVRHVISPDEPLVPIATLVDERYQQWLGQQQQAGVTFTSEERQWLDAIKDHIATNLSIDTDDLEEVPFSRYGGLGKAYQLFGERLSAILTELNERLAA
jgi:type I restriction enzyme R subunit